MKCVELRNGTEVGRLPRLEQRVFQAPAGNPVHVLYRLRHGGRMFDFGKGLHSRYDSREGFEHHNLLTRASFALERAVRGRPEQYYVRCSASVPFEDLLKDPQIEDLIYRVSAFGEISSGRK